MYENISENQQHLMNRRSDNDWWMVSNYNAVIWLGYRRLLDTLTVKVYETLGVGGWFLVCWSRWSDLLDNIEFNGETSPVTRGSKMM